MLKATGRPVLWRHRRLHHQAAKQQQRALSISTRAGTIGDRVAGTGRGGASSRTTLLASGTRRGGGERVQPWTGGWPCYTGCSMQTDSDSSRSSSGCDDSSGREASVAAVLAYHERSKHSFQRYAPGPGYLDWDTQPDPWRRFEGADLVPLPLEQRTPALDVSYAQLYGNEQEIQTLTLTKDTLSSFLYHSLALSAWKKYKDSSWSLRVNPSSGNLHPTEGYVILPELPELTHSPGLYHYTSKQHALEMRCSYTRSVWDALERWSYQQAGSSSGFAFFVGLTSIHWREAWKYGERAFRYCNHDVGHALGALRIAAAMHGWELRVLPNLADAQLARILGTDRKGDFHSHEHEEADLLAVVTPKSRRIKLREEPDHQLLASLSEQSRWFGKAAKLSTSHVPWPAIENVARATIKTATTKDTEFSTPSLSAYKWPTEYLARLQHLTAASIIRQRRSAVDFDGTTYISSDQFYGILSRTMPSINHIPWDAFAMWKDKSGGQSAARIHLGIFVHRVSNLLPGIYILARDVQQVDRLKRTMKHESSTVQYLWEKPADAPEELPLYLLVPGNFTELAAKISCMQEIAGDGCFSLGMLADFKETLDTEGPQAYRRLFWEAGLVGQILYLEAEAQGVRGTGIGCYFDDAMHQVFGLEDHDFQSLYHFTIGEPVEDTRLRTLVAYSMAGDG